MRLFFALCALLLSNIVFSADYLQELQAEAKRLELYDTNHWHTLLYYKRHWLSGRLSSEVDDDQYFLSKLGKREPEKELLATLSGFFSPQLDDDHAQCRFPARFHWLVDTLAIERSRLPQPNCENFKQWFTKANAGGATIVFPAAYLDSPSSMFGHTLLRLDQRNQNNSNRVLAYTVNYAAHKAEDDSELLFVYRGLVGGYPGETTILPYYMKLKEYSDIESRDIWEYKLDLSQQQTDQLVRHIWEIQSVQFDYYFFSENCSYRVLGMLDVVLPEQRMLNQFTFYAIPIDTVRLPLERGLVTDVAYRPSVITRFNHDLNELTEDQRQMVYQIVTDATSDLTRVNKLDGGSKSAVLDVAYQYSRLVNIPDRNMAKVSYELLKVMQHVDEKSNIAPISAPLRRDDEGHLSSRVRLLGGFSGGVDFQEVQLRPAYHDLTDPALGYPLGSELKFFELTARYYDNGKSLIEDVTLIGIKSLKGRNQFFKPTSWSVAVGARQISVNEERGLTPQLTGQLGPAYCWGNVLAYGLVGGELRLSSKFDKNIDIRGQANIGLLWRTSYSQFNLDLQYDASVAGYGEFKKLSYQQVVNINSRWAIYLNASREINLSSYRSEVGAGAMYYY